MMKQSFRCLLLMGLFAVVSTAFPQETGPLTTLTIKRITVENFVEDPIVLGNRPGNTNKAKILHSTFVLTSPDTGQSIYWSPQACRILAVKSGKGSNANGSLLEMTAEGTHPLSISIGTVGKPKYFGFRLVEGVPEFLYTYGQLSVEERISLSADGKKLIQSFKVSANAGTGSYSLSSKWRALATADNGKWSNNVLALTKEEMSEGFALTFHLDPDRPKTTASSD